MAADGLVKLIAGAVLSVGVLSLQGCNSLYQSNLKQNIGYGGIQFIQYPEHMRGTFMDPFPPGMRGYDQPELIKKTP